MQMHEAIVLSRSLEVNKKTDSDDGLLDDVGRGCGVQKSLAYL